MTFTSGTFNAGFIRTSLIIGTFGGNNGTLSLVNKDTGESAILQAGFIDQEVALEMPNVSGTLMVGRIVELTLSSGATTVATPSLLSGENIWAVTSFPGSDSALVFSGIYEGNINFLANGNAASSVVRVLISKLPQ